MSNRFFRSTSLVGLVVLPAVAMSFLVSCEPKPGEDKYAMARELCKGLEKWDYLVCVRPELTPRMVEARSLRAQLQSRGDQKSLEMLARADSRAMEVFEYCSREIAVAESCADEALQAEIDMIQLEMGEGQIAP